MKDKNKNWSTGLPNFGIKEIGILQQSKKWDMDISFEELIKHNPTCKIEGEYDSHWSDDGFGGMCLYMQHPLNDTCSSIITISKDGFCYDGDGGSTKEFINTEEAIKKMHDFRAKKMKEQN